MSAREKKKSLAVVLLAALGLALGTSLLGPVPLLAEEELARKVKNKIAPVYPDMARRMSISGTVKVLVVVAPNGNLKNTKIVGGHPLLVNAAMDAIKKWKFEPAAEETTGVVEFKFAPEN